MKKSKKDFKNTKFSIESGSLNLESMESAHNYNNYIADTIEERLKRDDKVLDFGAGTGLFAKKLRERGFQIDVSEVESKLLEDLHISGFITFHNLDDIPDTTYSIIYSLNVLEHIEDDVLVIKKLFDKLKPGGQLILYLPAFPALYSKMDKKVGHYRRYTKKNLVKKIQLAGFGVPEIKFADSLGTLGVVAYKLNVFSSGNLSSRTVTFYDKFLFPISRLIDSLFYKIFGKNIWAFVQK